MFALVKARKSIPRTIFMLVLTNKRLSSRNQILPYLSRIENSAMIMPYVLRGEPSSFCIPTLVGQIKKANLAANVEIMTLILLLKAIKALTSLAQSL